jgi:hypothetical protein
MQRVIASEIGGDLYAPGSLLRPVERHAERHESGTMRTSVCGKLHGHEAEVAF